MLKLWQWRLKMADNPFDFKKILEQAQDMQKKWQKAQAGMAKVTVTGESGAGAVKITMDSKAVTKVSLSKEIMTEGQAVLEDLIAAAINDALRKQEKLSQENLTNLAKNLSFPT